MSTSIPPGRGRWGPRARLDRLSEAPPPFAADARNHAYVEWLENMSMLGDANNVARQLSGQAGMWLNPYAYPNPRAAVDRASVWFTAYPLSLITAPGQSYLAALGAEDLWTAFEQIGVEAMHIGPVKRAGGISGWDYTASVDGHFDRISMALDPLFGTERDFRDHVRGGSGPRWGDHRRHRARAHRQGRRLPARRDEPQGLSRGSTTWWTSPRRTGTCCRTSRPVRTRSTSIRPPRRPCRRRVTSSARCSG